MFSTQAASQSDVIWSYQYPLTRQEVSNSAVSRFQSGIVNLAEASDRNSVVDFTRNYYLNGNNYPANTEPSIVLADIHKFVDSAAGYGRNDVDKAKLKKYMATRGGQNHNFLLQELIKANHFFNHTVRGESSISQNLINANWSINKAGKIELFYCVDIQSIEFKHHDNAAVFTLVADGSNELACYDPTSLEFAERKLAGLAPLMRVKAKMQLEIRNGIVLPVVTQLNVDGYNSKLSVHQESFANNHDERNLHTVRLLSLIDAGIKEFEKDINIKFKLQQIKRLVELSNFGEDMAAIKLACQYIERTTCYFYKHFYNFSFDKFYMADIFKEDLEISQQFKKLFGVGLQKTITEDGLNNKLKSYGILPNEPINEEIYGRSAIINSFANIYLQLQKHLHNYQPVSSYQYPVQSGNLDAAFFKKWQQTPPELTEGESLDDFKVRCRIQHHCLNENSNDKYITDVIRDLINERNTLPDADKTALFDWIKLNKHKNSDLLARLLVSHHEIRIKANHNQRLQPDNLRHTIKINRESAEWDIDIDGNIALTCVYYISAIESQRQNTFAFKSSQTNQLKFDSDATISENNKPPIVRIESKISLPVKDGKVTPQLKKLKIDSYTNDVTPMRFVQTQASLPGTQKVRDKTYGFSR